MSYRSIQSLLTSSEPSDLQGLLAQCQRHHQMARQVQALLPPELIHYCTLGELDGDRLVMIAASGAWATRLRYAADALLHDCNHHFGTKVSQLSIKIDGSLFRECSKKAEPSKQAKLSPEAHELIKQALNDGDDSVLRPFLEGLNRIATEQKKTD